MKASAKKNYIQITEARYSKMDDATFLKAFEEEHENPIELRVDETLTSPKYLPFFEACLTAKQFEEIREDIVDGVAFFEQLLDCSNPFACILWLGTCILTLGEELYWKQ